jgi:Tol biopolymer transport system component
MTAVRSRDDDLLGHIICSARRRASKRGPSVSARRIVPLLFLVSLTLGLGTNASATTPGPNGRIVFGSTRDGNSELYSVNANGSALRRLTWTPGIEQFPSVSSDGRVAYEGTGPNGGRSRIWVMNADGSAQTQVSPGNDLGVDTDPEWSPDGTSIAFASTRGGTWSLWVMNADGSGLRRVSDVFASSVAWSPDGRQLAYTGLGGIGVVGLDGSSPHVVTAPGAFADGPSWSPQGDQIVFSRSNAGYPGELYVVNLDGSGERQLTSGGFKNALPSWSPDGTQIVTNETAHRPGGTSGRSASTALVLIRSAPARTSHRTGVHRRSSRSPPRRKRRRSRSSRR